ncbi:two-component sensor histidine kinase BarA [Psychromonas sp. MB-3u-54]|uniref:two-component sensor histidine kinase BarA n=1 Tax=Psychromonas sp. MB-3u-54 TaxID=2058319 RepID=UPI000C32B667|nr:two-component sensor histidine kinase BarA [Psychromonas sp. MB-3u-54]PKH03311.1 two-component sensor histidine kinase BarA [Psychromonas sp. MB-3u-54]
MTKYGLRAQVIAFTILPTILIGGILASYFSFHRYQQANDFLIDRAINISEPLAIASEYGIQDETRTILRRLIGSTHRKNSPMIKSIAIFDTKNQLFVTSNYHRNFDLLRLKKGQEIPLLTDVQHHKDSIIIRSPIVDESHFLEYPSTFEQTPRTMGYIALEVNTDEIVLLLYRDTALSFGVVLLGILGSILLAFGQAKRIIGPISAMVSVVEKISLGRLNSRVEGDYSGEIASLQLGINEMAVAMSKHHEEMQDSIDLATSELRETLDQMEIQNIELDITKKKAQQAALVKSEFLANMSHELRTPLNGVIGFARQLLKTQLTTNQIDYLQTIERSAGNLLNIINDILDFSKLEAGKLTLEHIPFDLRDCIDETIHLLAPSVHEKNIELSLIVDPEVPHQVFGDAMRLQQILTNLIGNAIKFTEQGNIKIQIQCIENKTDIDDKITLKMMISDSGIGISKKQQAQLFKAFSQADTSITRQYGGTGLGLVITQKLVKEMQGRIELISIPEQGSTFGFTIVLEKSARAAFSNIALNRLEKQKVLVFESNEYAARACTQLLSEWKTQSLLAKTEQQWQQLLNKHYDSIVIGYSHVKNLHPLFKHIKQAKLFSENIIILVNSSDPSIYETLMATGVSHCLSKPINHKNFANALISDKKALNKIIRHKALPIFISKDINVMVVDDNSANLKLMAVMLADRANHVTTCINGQQAVEQSKRHHFDLIFMDIQMPVLDGISACLQIKAGEINYKTPVIAVTAHALPGEKDQFLQLGMDDCLPKPIDEIALQQMINKWTPDAKMMDSKSLLPRLTPRVKFTQKNLSIDWPLALQQSAGKETLAKELLGMLITEFSQIKIEVNKALHGDIDTLHFAQIIHKFHGGCSYSGVPKLKKITCLIENELKQGITLELLEPELLELLDELECVAQQAKKYLA